MLNNERSKVDWKGNPNRRIHSLGTVIFSTVVVLAGCSNIPREQIAAFTSSYADVDVAGRAIYVAYEGAVSRAFGVREPTTSNRFSAIYYDTVSAKFRNPEKSIISDDLAARYAAMDAMLVFNDGLSGIVEGRGLAEIKAAVAPLQLIVSTAAGPAGASLSAITDFVATGVVAAESRA